MKGDIRMLYLFDEYVAEYPNRYTSALEKFKSYTTYLHEMSFCEVQEIVSNWKPLSERTAYNQRKQILYYFQWLQSQGIKVDITIPQKLEIPLDIKKFLIYSTADIAYYYNELFKFLEKQCTINGTSYSKKSYYVSFAASILAFYGMTEEEILALDLSDVQKDGVKGYENLPLTEDDIQVLLAYKNVTRYANNKPLLGKKYIRSANNCEIDKAFMSRPIWRIAFDEEHLYLKNLLRVSNIYYLGLLNRLYNIDSVSEKRIEANNNHPQWFIDMLNDEIGDGSDLAPNTYTAYKKDYIAYRKEREKSNSQNKNYDTSMLDDFDNEEISLNFSSNVTKNQQNFNRLEKEEKPIQELNQRVDRVLDVLKALTGEMGNIKNELDKIKK